MKPVLSPAIYLYIPGREGDCLSNNYFFAIVDIDTLLCRHAVQALTVERVPYIGAILCCCNSGDACCAVTEIECHALYA